MEVGKRLSSGIMNVGATNSCFSLYLQIKSFVVQLLTKVLHAQKEKKRNYIYRFLHYLPKKGKKSTRAFIIRFNSRTLILHISEFDSNPVSHFIFVSRLEPQELKCSLVLSQMYFRWLSVVWTTWFSFYINMTWYDANEKKFSVLETTIASYGVSSISIEFSQSQLDE